jgi:hypothetical protein
MATNSSAEQRAIRVDIPAMMAGFKPEVISIDTL